MSDHDIASTGFYLLVGGTLASGENRIAIENPASGDICATVPAATPLQLEAAVAAAAAATDWRADEALRRKTLQAMAVAMEAHADELARLLSLEIGLPMNVARDEVAAARGFLLYRAQAALPSNVIYDDARQSVAVARRPIGVVGAIIPWNAPVLIACEKIATAFAAGNAVVVKPSPLAPLTLLKLGELWAPVVPAGALSVLPGDAELGADLVAHPRVGMISFTGSIRAGQAIMAAGAPGLKRLSLELGGNDAAIVLPDIDVAKMASRIFMGAFYRSGQICAAIKRLYVHRDVAADLTEALKTLAEGCVLGDPFDATTTMGPLSNRQQFEIVSSLVKASMAQGGVAIAGGSVLDRPGYFYRPTLVTGVTDDNPLVQEEQFGPALPIIPVASAEEAIARANATRFGLGGSVWTADIERGAQIAASLECGSAWINRHGIVQPDIPFGGMKLSGLGRANGDVGLDSYAELQTVSFAKPR